MKELISNRNIEIEICSHLMKKCALIPVGGAVYATYRLLFGWHKFLQPCLSAFAAVALTCGKTRINTHTQNWSWDHWKKLIWFEKSCFFSTGAAGRARPLRSTWPGAPASASVAVLDRAGRSMEPRPPLQMCECQVWQQPFRPPVSSSCFYSFSSQKRREQLGKNTSVPRPGWGNGEDQRRWGSSDTDLCWCTWTNSSRMDSVRKTQGQRSNVSLFPSRFLWTYFGTKHRRVHC